MADSNRVKIFRLVCTVVFVIYLALLAYFLFFSDIFGRTVTFDEYRYNLKPFAEIKRYLTKIRDKDFASYMINIAGNVILFMPFGFLFPFVSDVRKFKRGRTFLGTFVVTVLFCFLIEGIQLVSKVGVFDVDDIIMNTFGSVMGYAIFRIVILNHRMTKKKREAERDKEQVYKGRKAVQGS